MGNSLQLCSITKSEFWPVNMNMEQAGKIYELLISSNKETKSSVM